MHLQHFKEAEFRGWFDDMSPRLLVLLDVLRHMLGSAIYISASTSAIGRRSGRENRSTHNIDCWEKVYGIDFFVDHVFLRAQAYAVVDTAKKLGFTGIGVYADTKNNEGKVQVMFHLDTRPDRPLDRPATWGRVNGEYTTIGNALQHVPFDGKEAA